jgi:hypothetical protein
MDTPVTYEDIKRLQRGIAYGLLIGAVTGIVVGTLWFLFRWWFHLGGRP